MKSIQVILVVIVIGDLLNMKIIDKYILLFSTLPVGIDINELFDLPPISRVLMQIRDCLLITK